MDYIYLDHLAVNPTDQRVIDAMLPYLSVNYGNPMALYAVGQAAAEGMTLARQQTAALINAQPEEIIFASNGSEANNFALKGLAAANQNKGKHIITSAIEHFSVLHPLRSLEKGGYKVTQVPVDKYGTIDLAELKKAITPETCLISMTFASNEIGTIEPIGEIAKIAQENKIIFHTDAVQAAGTIPIDVRQLGVDALSLAASQFYGPKGAAALYLKKGTRVVPLIEGGIQEGGRRAGTENVSGIVGLGKAAELAKLEMADRTAHLRKLQQQLISGLENKVPTFHLTGHPENRLPNHVSGVVDYIEGESMTMFLDMEGIAISSGSACVSKALKASHVVLAIGVDPARVNGSIVLSPGKGTSAEQIDYFLTKFPPIVERLQAMSPLNKKKG